MATQDSSGLIKVDYGALGDELARKGTNMYRSSMSCCGGGNPREAEKLLQSACDQYRTAGLWRKRAETYSLLAQFQEEDKIVKNINLDAVLEFRTLSAESFAECEMYGESFRQYEGAATAAKLKNDYRAAGNVLSKLADAQVDAGDKEAAIVTLQDAADCYEMSNGTVTGAQLLVKRAAYLCDLKNYEEAQNAYFALIESQKIPFQAVTFGFKCQIAAMIDMVMNPGKNRMESNDSKLKSLVPSWAGSPERRLIESCYTAYKLGADGVTDFSHACAVYNDTNILDDWSVTILLKIKKILQTDESDSENDSEAKDSDIDLEESDTDDEESQVASNTPKTRTDLADSASDSGAAIPDRDEHGVRLSSEAKKAAKEEIRKAKVTKSRSELFAEKLQ